jgi:predicted RNase H-like HicB family nuclease
LNDELGILGRIQGIGILKNGEIIMRYAIVIEKSEDGYGAYVPDLPGCVAVGENLKETEALIKEAIEFHIEGMKEDGTAIPEPTSVGEYVEI